MLSFTGRPRHSFLMQQLCLRRYLMNINVDIHGDGGEQMGAGGITPFNGKYN